MLPRDLPAEQFVDFARRAEELGFDELWVVEDLGFRGGIAQAATALAVTARITVGIGILPAAARNVVFAAMDVATLAQLHPNRLVVGIGHGMPGWMQQAGAWPSRPLSYLREYTRALDTLLRGGSAHAGAIRHGGGGAPHRATGSRSPYRAGRARAEIADRRRRDRRRSRSG